MNVSIGEKGRKMAANLWQNKQHLLWWRVNADVREFFICMMMQWWWMMLEV